MAGVPPAGGTEPAPPRAVELQYPDRLPENPMADATETPATTVEVRETLTGRYAQSVRAGSHELVADEPVAAGGGDTGPGPYEYLLAALGACTSITLRMYAAQKKWPLQRVQVRLAHRKIHAQDCRDCETREGKVDEITREILLEGTLDDEQRLRLLEIANRCPVHRTLTSEIKVRSRLARPGWETEPWDAD